jgi:lipid A 3-O-deacylase
VKKWIVSTLMSAALAMPAAAQTGIQSPVREVASHPGWEYGPLVQGGLGVTDNRSGYKFIMAGVHVGRVLTPELGSGFLKGQFEFAAELFPYWQSNVPKFQRVKCNSSLTVCSPPYTVGGTYHGVSLTPVILRWNMTNHRRIMPWVQGAGGLIWTNHKYPPYGSATVINLANAGPTSETSVWNFTPQAGVGMHYFVKPRRSIDFGANAVHISNASMGDRNPGVNVTLQFNVGYTWWK